MFNFGVGSLIAIPDRMADGTKIATPTPVKLASLQECSIDLSVDIKTLYGAGRYPIAVAQGKAKVELKAKYASISAEVMGSLFFGQTATAGVRDIALSAAAIPATGSLAVVPPNSGTFVGDFGVTDTSTGKFFTRVSSGPVAGQYTVDASGNYTFATADAGIAVAINFEYSATTGGKVFAINNQTMGSMPSFSVVFRTTYDGKSLTGKFYKGTSGKLALPMKNEDFTISDFDAQFFANDADQVGWLCLQ